ncbi:MAG TPA: tetratricopeptide repeat protein [Methylotenera sp.]|nr:tetratricopeptide repeat protein [Methylotenera sp.]HPH05461.1 tetratricopeptide repeat protein [Methylotenera sp.]HPN01402.1 tetratricopeptide repeat protein [Methylotenera sp.]
MINKQFWHGLLVFILLLSLAACDTKKTAETPAVSDKSTILFDAIQIVLKAEELNKAQQWKKAIAILEKVILQHGKSADPNLQEEVAKAMLEKGYALDGLKLSDKALQTYNTLIERYGASNNIEVQVLVANAMMNKSYLFNDLKNSQDEAKTYDEIISRLASSSNARLRQHVDVAYNNKGFGLILQAKQTWDDALAREALLTQALTALEQAAKATSSETKAMALGNTAYAKWLLGRTDEAKAPLTEALKMSGVWLYEGELSDTKQHTVPADAGFVALLDKVWQEVQPKAASKDAQPNETKPKDEKKSGATIHI